MQSLVISALTEPNRQKSRRKKGFWAQKSQPETANHWRLSIAPLNRNAALLSLSLSLSLVSEIARFLGSAMGIAIANRKNRCDFGALSA